MSILRGTPHFPYFRIASTKLMTIRTKLLLALIPSTIFILIATGFVTNWFSSQFLNEAVQRNVRLRTLALAHEVEIFLNHCREDVLELRERPLTRQEFVQYWESLRKIYGWPYAGMAYLSAAPGESFYLVSKGEELLEIPPPDISLVRPDPRNILRDSNPNDDDEVWVSPILEGRYPIPEEKELGQLLSKRVIRFMSLVKNADGTNRGLVVMSVSVYQLRDILTRFQSPQSPLFAFVRSPELRYSFLLDMDGWILFQSEESPGRSIELSVRLARSGLSGSFGKPGLPFAFKPNPEHSGYWQMVSDLRQGKSGLIMIEDTKPEGVSVTDPYYMGYAPVRISPGPGKEPVVFAGVAFVDRSKLGMWAGFRQIDVIFIIALITILFVSIIIYGLGRVITNPIFALAAEVNKIQESRDLREIVLPDHDHETTLLKDSINNMLATIRKQVDEIKLKDEQLIEASLSERAMLEQEIRALKQQVVRDDIIEIQGHSEPVESLKVEILKAASVDADVLVLGETGTGKQLAAEAIHNHCARADRPFITINCGALDEHLLLDELFGHIKGAFTEARTDRKGAFLAAQGGTLFLDEIGTASPKIQQSLLRALAMRKISPLGSDREHDVDVRVIAATNEDLRALVEMGAFREDLYYRLNVLTIQTPPLRYHPEDIPVLADHFLKEACRRMNRRPVGLTRGALAKLRSYPWPGNIRELKNCLLRAVAMAEGSLIHSDDILQTPSSGNGLSRSGKGAPASESVPQADLDLPVEPELYDHSPSSPPPFAAGIELNERQRRALPVLLGEGEITRTRYQDILGNLPTRTAIYDLQDLVKKGLVEMTGRGPATRYRLKHPPDRKDVGQ